MRSTMRSAAGLLCAALAWTALACDPGPLSSPPPPTRDQLQQRPFDNGPLGASAIGDGELQARDRGPVTGGCTSTDLVPVPLESLRLNDAQFESAVRGLFPYEVTFAPALDSTVIVAETFSTFPGVNEVLLGHQQTLVALSEAIALEALDRLDELLPCDPAVDGEQPCAEAFIDGFASRAFRRPLEPGERAGLIATWVDLTTDATEPLTFEEGIAAVIQIVLLSPQLMYQVEIGEALAGSTEIVELTDYELASRLSFLFWNAPPDDTLMQLAADGELSDPDVLQAQAIRLVDDPRAEAATANFFLEWFGVAGHFFNDRVDDTLADAFNQEAERNVATLLEEGSHVDALLSYDETWVNAPLADHYGISPNPSSGADDWQRVPLPAERGGGLLTTAVFAAATAHASNHTSFIHRGKAVRERLLCGELGIPDPSFLDQDPELPEDATVRDKMDTRMQMNPCGDCHILMDPIGIGMEDLDQQGRFRTQYANGQTVDAEGEVLFISELAPAFHGAVELAQKLAPTETFSRCASDQWLRYVVGRRDLDELDCLLEQIGETQEALGGDLRAMLIAAVTTDAFRYRVIEAP